MTLNQIIYFEKTAECLHMASAARDLMIAQPSLSMSINKLEEELGMPLFEKQGRGIILTPQGKHFFVHAKSILHEVEMAKVDMQRLKNETEASITLGYIHPLSNNFVPTIYREFKKKMAEQPFNFKSIEKSTSDLVQDLRNNAIDVALCLKVNNDEDLTQIPILRQNLILIVPKGHEIEKEYKTSGEPISAQSIAGYPLITYCENSLMRYSIVSFFDEQHIKANICHVAYNENAIAHLVSENFGIAIIAKTDGLSFEKISEIPVDGLEKSRNIYLTYKTNKKPFKIAKQMIGFIRQQYGLE